MKESRKEVLISLSTLAVLSVIALLVEIFVK